MIFKEKKQNIFQNKIKNKFNLFAFLRSNKNKIILIISLVIIIILSILINHGLKDESISSKDGLKIRLLGDNVITTTPKSDFLDPGYIATDKNEGDLTNEVQILGIIDFNTPGTYIRHYTVQNSRGTVVEINRTIIIEEDDGPFLTLTLKGNSIVEIKKGTKYIEPGYTAHDDTGKDLTKEVKVTSDLDINKIGTYTNTYILTVDGITKTEVRTIKVVKQDIKDEIVDIHTTITTSNKELTNSSIKIILTIEGTDYNYTISPNQMKSYNKTINYTVSNNGTYVFNIYDKNGNVKTIEKVIKNIDNILPTGSCYMNKDGLITTTITDNNEILGYSYYINGQYTSYYKTKSYQDKYTTNQTAVRVLDKAGNIAYIKCDKEIIPDTLNPIMPTSFKYKVESDTLKVWVVDKKDYYLTRIWAKESYKQIHKYTSSDYNKSSDKFNNIMEKALKNVIKNKIAVAWNDSVHVDYMGGGQFSKYNPHGLVINEGKILRNDVTSKKERWKFYGIDNKNVLNYYPDDGSMTTEKRRKIYDSAINGGVLNTFVAARRAVKDGLVVGKNTRSDGSSYYSSTQQGICQIDKNNFIYVTAKKSYMPKAFAEVLLKLGCYDAYYTDAGGSLTFYLKKENSNKWTHIKGTGSRSPSWSVMYWTEI